MVIVGIVSNGGIGTIAGLIHIPSMIITFGGAIFAVLITSESFADFKDGLHSFRIAFSKENQDLDEIGDVIYQLALVARKEGMLLIIQRMKAFGGGAPIVFTGDHNCRENEEPAQAVSKILSNALFVTETPPTGPWRTFTGWNYRANEVSSAEALKLPVAMRNARTGSPDCGPRIDYIYVTPGVRVKDYATHADTRPGTTLYPSDHFPVTATIEL